MNVRNPYQGFPPPAGAPTPATAVEPSAREKIARFKTLSRRAFRYWKLTFVILLLGMAASLAVALTVKLTYRSECTVVYRNTMRPGERDDELSPERARQIGAKLKDLLTTRSRLEALIEEYNLYPKIVASKGVVEAVEEMRLHIGFRARDSQTYVISFETEVPQVARDVTKSLADSMIADFTSTATNTAKQEADFLAKQEDAGAVNLENANKALATFLTLHPEFAVEGKTAFGPGGGEEEASRRRRRRARRHTTPRSPSCIDRKRGSRRSSGTTTFRQAAPLRRRTSRSRSSLSSATRLRNRPPPRRPTSPTSAPG